VWHASARVNLRANDWSGDHSSLRDGSLAFTPMRGASGTLYFVATMHCVKCMLDPIGRYTP